MYTFQSQSVKNLGWENIQRDHGGKFLKRWQGIKHPTSAAIKHN